MINFEIEVVIDNKDCRMIVISDDVPVEKVFELGPPWIKDSDFTLSTMHNIVILNSKGELISLFQKNLVAYKWERNSFSPQVLVDDIVKSL